MRSNIRIAKKVSVSWLVDQQLRHVNYSVSIWACRDATLMPARRVVVLGRRSRTPFLTTI